MCFGFGLRVDKPQQESRRDQFRCVVSELLEVHGVGRRGVLPGGHFQKDVPLLARPAASKLQRLGDETYLNEEIKSTHHMWHMAWQRLSIKIDRKKQKTKMLPPLHYVWFHQVWNQKRNLLQVQVVGSRKVLIVRSKITLTICGVECPNGWLRLLFLSSKRFFLILCSFLVLIFFTKIKSDILQHPKH
jgi:hypothetical protein